jgi:hypothetical protein
MFSDLNGALEVPFQGTADDSGHLNEHARDATALQTNTAVFGLIGLSRRPGRKGLLHNQILEVSGTLGARPERTRPNVADYR